MIIRCKFLGSAIAAGVCSRLAIARDETLPIGVTDWNLNLGASPEAVPLASHLWIAQSGEAKLKGPGSDCRVPNFCVSAGWQVNKSENK